MKFKHKIWMLPVSAGTFFAAGLLASYWVTAGTAESLRQLRTVDYPYLEAVQRLDREAEQLRLTLQSAAAEGDKERLEGVIGVVGRANVLLEEMASIPGKQALASRLRDQFISYQRAAVSATKALIDRRNAHAEVRRMQEAQGILVQQLAMQLKLATAATQARQLEADRGLSTTLWVNLLTGMVVLLMLANASSLIVRSLWCDLGDEPAEIRALMNQVAQGRLDVMPEVNPSDKFSIKSGLRDMMVRTAATVMVIHQVADAIRRSAERQVTDEVDPEGQDTQGIAQETSSSALSQSQQALGFGLPSAPTLSALTRERAHRMRRAVSEADALRIQAARLQEAVKVFKVESRGPNQS